MKKILFVSWTVLFLTSFVWAQEKIEAPVWKIGDKWTYRDDNGWQWTVETIGDERDFYINTWKILEGKRKGEWRYFYDKKNMNCIKVIKDGKENREQRYVDWKFFDFPFYVGKRWNYTYTYGMADMLEELSVIGIEEVDILAGKFKTIKIKGKATAGKIRPRTYDYYYWWSPEVKSRVKQELEGSNWSTYTDYTKFELIYFELK